MARHSVRAIRAGQYGNVTGRADRMGQTMARQSAQPPRSSPRSRLEPRIRRLLLFVSALVFTDTIFFTALTPLLPHYVHAVGLSKAGAGVLVAAYPFGTLAAALPAG